MDFTNKKIVKVPLTNTEITTTLCPKIHTTNENTQHLNSLREDDEDPSTTRKNDEKKPQNFIFFNANR